MVHEFAASRSTRRFVPVYFIAIKFCSLINRQTGQQTYCRMMGQVWLGKTPPAHTLPVLQHGWMTHRHGSQTAAWDRKPNEPFLLTLRQQENAL